MMDSEREGTATTHPQLVRSFVTPLSVLSIRFAHGAGLSSRNRDGCSHLGALRGCAYQLMLYMYI